MSYWPLGEREREHLCWIEGNHMYFICGRSLTESPIAVTLHLFVEQPVASPYSEDRSLLSVPNL